MRRRPPDLNSLAKYGSGYRTVGERVVYYTTLSPELKLGPTVHHHSLKSRDYGRTKVLRYEYDPTRPYPPDQSHPPNQPYPALSRFDRLRRQQCFDR